MVSDQNFLFKVDRIEIKLTQQAHDVKMTSDRRRCDVMTSHRRRSDVILTTCACWGDPLRALNKLIRKGMCYTTVSATCASSVTL